MLDRFRFVNFCWPEFLVPGRSLFLCAPAYWDYTLKQASEFTKLEDVQVLFLASLLGGAVALPLMLWLEWSTVFERWKSEFAGTNIVLMLLLCGGVRAAGLLFRVVFVGRLFSSVHKALVEYVWLLSGSTVGTIIFGNRLGLLSFIGVAAATGGAWRRAQLMLQDRSGKERLPETGETSTDLRHPSHAARRAP